MRAEKAKIQTKVDFEIELSEKKTLREMLQFCIDTIPGKYLDVVIPQFFRSMAVSGIVKMLTLLNIKFHD